MKKLISTILTIITVLGFTIGLAGCNKENDDPYFYNALEDCVDPERYAIQISKAGCNSLGEFYDFEEMKYCVSAHTELKGYFVVDFKQQLAYFLPQKDNIVKSLLFYNGETQEYFIQEFFYCEYPLETYLCCYFFPIINYNYDELRYEFGGGKVKNKRFTGYSRYINIYLDNQRIACVDIFANQFLSDIPQRWWINYLDKYFKWVQIVED